MGMTEVDHRELLDGDGEVIGYVDADGMAHEFAFKPGEEEEVYPLDDAADQGKSRAAGEPLLVPDGFADWLD